jgi:hypothetical protein
MSIIEHYYDCMHGGLVGLIWRATYDITYFKIFNVWEVFEQVFNRTCLQLIKKSQAYVFTISTSSLYFRDAAII